jgi:cytochrome c oxidase subunit II
VGRRSGRYAKVGAAVALLLLLTGCSRARLEEDLRFGWPRGVTEQARDMRVLWTWSSVAALVVGVLVWGLIFWAIIVYRRRDSELPKQTKYGLPIELIYTVLPFLIVAVLFYYTVTTQTKISKFQPNPDVTVTVVGFQWNWEFDYDNYNGTEVRDPVTREFLYTIGTPTEIPVLVLPVGKRIRIIEESNDVVHSFWVPEFLFKRDVFPPPQINTYEINTTTTGSFVGRCAELCGTYHSQMNFEVRIVSAEDFQRYLTALAGFGNADQARQAKALAAIGQPRVATTTYPFNTDRRDRSPSTQPQTEQRRQGGTP